MIPIQIKTVRYYPIAMPYKTPFRTGYGVETHKTAVIVEVVSASGVTGWGEVSVERRPAYGAETLVTAGHILKDFLIPAVVGQMIDHPAHAPNLWRSIRGHLHTKAGLEAAIWDCFAKTNQMRLLELFRAYLGLIDHTNETVAVGVVIGLTDTLGDLFAIIEQRLGEGYRTIKLKITRDHGLHMVEAVRLRYPDLPLILDANGDYQLEDAAQLKALDAFNILMIEQPLAHNDILEHSILQRQLATPLCLDESIQSLHDVRLAHHLGVASAINLKPARVGGFTEALNIHRFAQHHGLRLRVGGLLETGIGRAGLLALAALPCIGLPSDISATSRYFATDLMPPVELKPDGTIQVAAGIGIGPTVDRNKLASFRGTGSSRLLV